MHLKGEELTVYMIQYKEKGILLLSTVNVCTVVIINSALHCLWYPKILKEYYDKIWWDITP